MRALITGYGGFVGYHLAEHLLEATDWQLFGTAYSQAELVGRPEMSVRTSVVDLRQPGAVKELVEEAQPDVVYHLAGQAFVPESWADPWATFETNVRMQINILESVVGRTAPGGQRVRVVAAISNEVYGAADPDALPLDETAPIAPVNPYASSKAAQDLVVGQYVRSRDVDAVRIRPFNHIGPRQDGRFVVASFARQVAEAEAGVGATVLRVGDLTAERDFSDVRDIVRGYRLAGLHGACGAVYNLGCGRAHTIQEVLDFFLAQAKVSIRVEEDPRLLRPADVPRTLCDASKARRELGWSPEIPFETTLTDVLDDWRRRVRPASNAHG